MEFHEVVSIWPKMQADEFTKLVEDIKVHGLRESIWTHQGKIIDGRHRHLACQEAGVAPKFQEWDGQGSLIMFVASLNQHRRHLDAGQRAMVALEIEKQLSEEAETNKKLSGGNHGNQYTGGKVAVFQNFEKPPLEPVHAAKQAAKLTGTNHQYVIDAKKIVNHAPELKTLVMNRVMSLPDAKKLAKEDTKTRQTVIQKITSGQVKKVGTALLEIKKEEIVAQAVNAPTKPQVHLVSWERWLPSQERCDLLITDPPYSTDIADIQTFANRWLPLALSKVKSTGRAYVCIGAYPHELQAYLNVEVPTHLRLLNILVWTYKNTLGPQPHNAYKQNWQAILYFVGENAPRLDCPIMNEQFSVMEINAPDGRLGDRYHGWQKPDELAERLIRHSTKLGDIVLDCFAGTGTFLLAAHRLGRTAYGCDVSSEMLDIAKMRGCEVIYEVQRSA